MLELINVGKHYRTKSGSFEALSNINLTIRRGDIFGIIGQSGAGKSTLVRCMNLLEKPTEGKVMFGATDITQLASKDLRNYRRRVGMIFQQFHLLEQKNVLENVCFALDIFGADKKTMVERAKEMLEMVGLSDKLDSYPSQLSGGQKQRVAIARALVGDPEILLCDEATSALDPQTRNSILELLRQINEKLGVTIIIITHEMGIVEAMCNRVAVLKNGKLEEIGDTEEVLQNPKTRATKELIGEKRIILDVKCERRGA